MCYLRSQPLDQLRGRRGVKSASQLRALLEVRWENEDASAGQGLGGETSLVGLGLRVFLCSWVRVEGCELERRQRQIPCTMGKAKEFDALGFGFFLKSTGTTEAFASRGVTCIGLNSRKIC